MSLASSTKSKRPMPADTAASFTPLTLCAMKTRSALLYMGSCPFSALMFSSEPTRTYRSPCSAASRKNSTWPEWSRSKQPETRTFFGMLRDVAGQSVERVAPGRRHDARAERRRFECFHALVEFYEPVEFS